MSAEPPLLFALPTRSERLTLLSMVTTLPTYSCNKLIDNYKSTDWALETLNLISSFTMYWFRTSVLARSVPSTSMYSVVNRYSSFLSHQSMSSHKKHLWLRSSTLQKSFHVARLWIGRMRIRFLRSMFISALFLEWVDRRERARGCEREQSAEERN